VLPVFALPLLKPFDRQPYRMHDKLPISQDVARNSNCRHIAEKGQVINQFGKVTLPECLWFFRQFS